VAFARRGIDRVALEFIPEQKTRRRLEIRLSKDLQSCGCGTAALFVSIGLIWFILQMLPPASLTLTQILRGAGLLLALALVGKALGLPLAEYRLRTTIRTARRIGSATADHIDQFAVDLGYREMPSKFSRLRR
jgi:hypothetical protein